MQRLKFYVNLQGRNMHMLRMTLPAT